MRGRFMLLAVVAATVVSAGAAPAAEKPPQWERDLATAREGIEAAAAEGRLAPEETARYAAALAAARTAIETLYPGRAAVVESVVADVARGASLYDRPRALTLFATLETNVEYLTGRAIPASGRDVQGADGAVYRSFAGALHFHPLANAAKLNSLLARNRDEEAFALAEALLARAVASGAGDVHEYWFTFHNVSPPWRSGMAQAVLAQALARAGERFAEPRFTAAATRAFAGTRGLVMKLDEGPWVRLYDKLGLVVLNAQLQAALSLGEYALLTGDAEADAFAAELRAAAAAALPRFDTGAWSRYALGSESSLEYHRYVVSLLKRLTAATGDPLWRETADRFALYETQPPVANAGPAPAALYPEPRDGHRDEAPLRIWVSKIGTVSVDGRRHRVTRGWNTVTWRPPTPAPPGFYQPEVTVTDLVGNETFLEVPPVEVRRDRERPRAVVRLRGRKLTWRVVDEGTARVRVTVAPGAARPLDLGWQPMRRTVRIARAVPRGAVVRVVDAAGNRAHVRLR